MERVAESRAPLWWRKANRMTPEGIMETEARAVADVRQHKALRAKLLDAGVLRTPRVWAA